MAKDTQKTEKADGETPAKAKAEGGEKKAKAEGGEKKAKAEGGEKKAKAEGGEKRAKGSKGGEKKSEKKKPSQPARDAVPARLFLRYKSEIVPTLVKEFGYKNLMQVPRITKVTINMGLGEAVSNPNIISTARSRNLRVIFFMRWPVWF